MYPKAKPFLVALFAVVLLVGTAPVLLAQMNGGRGNSQAGENTGKSGSTHGNSNFDHQGLMSNSETEGMGHGSGPASGGNHSGGTSMGGGMSVGDGHGGGTGAGMGGHGAGAGGGGAGGGGGGR